jgi:protein xylosyltransferase
MECCELVINMGLCLSDLPILLADLLHVLSELPRQLNFIEHTSDIGWKE